MRDNNTSLFNTPKKRQRNEQEGDENNNGQNAVIDFNAQTPLHIPPSPKTPNAPRKRRNMPHVDEDNTNQVAAALFNAPHLGDDFEDETTEDNLELRR